MFTLTILLTSLVSQAASLSPDQHRRAEAMTNYFENSNVNPQYDYIEDLHDGRGYTAGRAGFTTATGDLYDVVKKYCKEYYSSPLCGYLATLAELAKTESGDTKDLGTAFVRDWQEESKLDVFKAAQDSENENTYFKPSQKEADQAKVQSALGKAIFYDTLIQHGDGDDQDSIGALLSRTEKSVGSISDVGSESAWLKAFLEVRRQDLLNPYDTSSQGVWAESVDRVDFLESLLAKENLDLHGPIEMSPDAPSADTYIP